MRSPARSSFYLVPPITDPEEPSKIPVQRNPHQNVLLMVISVTLVALVTVVTTFGLNGKFI